MQALPLASPPLPENRLPDCVAIELEPVPVQPEAHLESGADSSQATTSFHQSEQVDLYLTIRFGTHTESPPGGFIVFGLRGGELSLSLKNCEMPLSNIELSESFKPYLPVKQTSKRGRENQGGLEFGWADNKPGTKLNTSRKETAEQTEEVQLELSQVRTGGTPEQPTWRFEAKIGGVLSGLLKKEKLGTLNVKQQPYQIEAKFQISLRDIELTDVRLPLMMDLIPEERATIDRGLAKLLLMHRLKLSGLKLSGHNQAELCLIRIGLHE